MLWVEPNIGMIKMYATGIASVHQLFLDFVADKEVEKHTTGQTYLLERYLNYVFDRALARIYIKHVEEINEYDFFTSENQPADYDYFYAESHQPDDYMYFLGEGNRALDVDFLVYVPAAILAVSEARIRANIEKYKLAGKRFKFIAI
jgi:hypothetical protein